MDLLKEKETTRVMTLLGEGRVSAMPDMAIIEIGVESTGDALSQLQEQNGILAQDMIDALQTFDLEDIKTIEYTIQKQYEYVEGQRIDKGFLIRNLLEIRTKELDQVGNIIDTAVNNGANLVQNIRFDLSESDDYRLKALNLAILNAYDKANSIANTFQYPLNPIPRSITENSASVGPFPTFSLAREIASTPIEIGRNTITSSVTVVFNY